MSRQEAYAKEVGMVAAIMADSILEKLYEKMQAIGTGYISTVEQISEWSIEFVNKHEKTKWEVVLEKGMKPQSSFMKEIICFDDCVMDFAHYKLNELN